MQLPDCRSLLGEVPSPSLLPPPSAPVLSRLKLLLIQDLLRLILLNYLQLLLENRRGTRLSMVENWEVYLLTLLTMLCKMALKELLPLLLVMTILDGIPPLLLLIMVLMLLSKLMITLLGLSSLDPTITGPLSMMLLKALCGTTLNPSITHVFRRALLM